MLAFLRFGCLVSVFIRSFMTFKVNLGGLMFSKENHSRSQMRTAASGCSLFSLLFTQVFTICQFLYAYG